MTPPAKPDGQQPAKANGKQPAKGAGRQPAKGAGRQPPKAVGRTPARPGGKPPAKAAATVAWEVAQRRWAVPAAALAGVLPLAAGIVVNAPLHNAPLNRIGGLLYFNAHAGALWAGSVLLALGAIATAATLLFMARAIAARDPARLPRATPWVIVAGSTLYGLVGTLLSSAVPPLGLIPQALTSSGATKFATTGAQTWQQADVDFSSVLKVTQYVGTLSSLLLLAGVVLVALNAIKVGLLTRFMGYVGVFVGALILVPVFSTLPVVQAFWFVALAALIAGRWPGQIPPAWASGKSEPWPTMAAQRERAAAGRGAPARGAAARAPAPAPPPPVRRSQSAAHPGEARRKRKRKR